MKAIGVIRLTKDPELRSTPNGKSVCTFTGACNRRYKREKSDFHKIIVWGKLGENCSKYLRKGAQAYIEGEIQNRSYDTDNGKRHITEIIADEVQFIGSKTNSDTAQGDNQMVEVDENLPF